MAIAAFVEERLDMGYDYGAVGGPVFATEIVTFGAGAEQRNAAWANARGRWELGERAVVKSKMDYVLGFFRARRGRLVGFRYRDWNDYLATGEALAPNGTPTVQLVKTYTSDTAGESERREIKKPVAASVSLVRGGSPFAGFAVDGATGLVTLNADWTAAITGITQANPAVVTVAGHGRSTDDVVYLSGIGGMTALNGAAYAITVTDTDHFKLDGIDSTGFAAYTSGGTAALYVQPDETLTWSGEFDVPARFDADQLQARFDAYDEHTGEAVYFLSALPVVELRL